jgi:thiol-disulfide isomerase/thioredoxin
MTTPLRLVLGVMLGLWLSGCAEDLGVDQHGRKVAAASLEGQWLVINYWAEWCTPCRREIPQMNQLADQLATKGAKVIGVNFDGLQGDALAKAADDMGIRFTVLAKDPSARYQLPRSEGLPVTYIVDASGKLCERLLGEQNAAGVSERLNALRGGS